MMDFLTNGMASGVDPRDYFFREMMPGTLGTGEVMSVTRLLVEESEYPITSLSGYFEGTTYGQRSYESFLAVLKTLGDEIDARNAVLVAHGHQPYEYLHPDNVPTSIDI